MDTSAIGLPDLDTAFDLAPDAPEAYVRDGHVLVRGLASKAEVEAYRPHIASVVETHNRETRKLEDRDTYGKAFLQITNLWQKSPKVQKFVFARRFAEVAARLMSASGVRLYHDQALFKEPGGGHTPWHQDQYYWPLDGVKTVTMWMPLVNVPVEMGALTFAGGSHSGGFMGHIKISDESEELFSRYVSDKGYPVVQSAMMAGDATFHSGWTLHSAPANNTDSLRQVMTVIYYEDGAVISRPDNPNRENDMRTWFPGLAPGDAAASDLNPLLYP